jgi:hypothetical protein
MKMLRESGCSTVDYSRDFICLAKIDFFIFQKGNQLSKQNKINFRRYFFLSLSMFLSSSLTKMLIHCFRFFFVVKTNKKFIHYIRDLGLVL